MQRPKAGKRSESSGIEERQVGARRKKLEMSLERQ